MTNHHDRTRGDSGTDRWERGDGRVRIPADVDRPDTFLGGLTARQLAILTLTAVTVWAGYATTRTWLPLPALGAVGLPLAGAGVAVALGRRDGLTADRLLAAALRQRRRPARLVLAPDGVQPAPGWAGPGGPLPAPLRLPLAGVSADGIVDLGPDGAALICRASAVTFALRTATEQRALVAGFGRWLNSLEAPVQILTRAIPVDLTPTIAALTSSAGALPDPGLEAAARDHAQFLQELAARSELLAQQVLLILRQPPAPGEDPGVLLRRRAQDATVALAAAGVTLTVLDGSGAVACLNACLDPTAPPPPSGPAGPVGPAGPAAPTEVITAASGSSW